jgi:hypothetical protein
VALGLRSGTVGAPHQSWRRESYGAWRHRIFGTKQRGGHEESYIGFGRREEAMPRARGRSATSLVQDVGGGLPRWSPGSQFQAHGPVSRSSSSSFAPIVVRSYESRMHGEIMMLGFYVLRLKIETNPGLFIGFFEMIS